MPFVNGKRVTLEEWRAANPVPTLYGYDTNGNRFIRYPGDLLETEVLPGVARQGVGEVEVRPGALGAIADALGLDPGEPEVIRLLLRTSADAGDADNTRVVNVDRGEA